MTGLAEAFRRNFDVYNRGEEVAHWATLTDLQPAERQILELLRDALPVMDMLDVGVGGGRSTGHFAPRVRSYLGVDFAPNMVEACRRKFPDLDFAVGDAANLSHCPNEAYDLVLFSYNGIDYLDPPGRLAALREFRRVLRPGGWLAFSSHNLNFFPVLRRSRRPSFSWHPRRLAGSLRRWVLFWARNRRIGYSPRLGEAIVFEGQLAGEAPTFYVRPDLQWTILQSEGWKDVRLFPNEGGEIADGMEAARKIAAPWVYYLCRKPKSA